MDKHLYNEDSIQSLTPLQHVRARCSMYIGSTDTPYQLVIEILSNAIDEYRIGNGDTIKLTVKDGIVKCQDNAQGFIVNSYREDGKSILQAAFDTLNTSGKFSSDGVYEGSALGLHGQGSKIANFLSNWMKVISTRDKITETVEFTEGEFVSREVCKTYESSGTTVIFHPSKEFFKTTEIDLKKLYNFCDDITCLCQGLTIVLNGKKISHKNGIQDLLEKNINDIELINNRFIVQEKKEKQALNLAMTFTSQHTSTIIPYVNCGITSAGPHITSIKTTITRVLNKWAKEQGILKTKDKNLDGSSLQEGMVFVADITADNVAYNAQIKDNIAKIDTSFISSTLGEQLEIYLDNNPDDGRIIIEKALVARKAAEAAKKARERVRNNATKQTKKKKFMDMPSKLADCFEKDRSICELYLTEGDSASGGCKTIRDASTQAIMGLRGKILNTLTSTPEGWHKNQEIMNIVQALGLSWSSNGKSVIYQEDKLRYDKFIIAADRDPDGSHIQTLILTMVWTLFPDLILNGHVYIALPPLYKAEWGTKYQYLDDKKALDDFRKTHTGFTLTYFKGLGEASPQELGMMIMDPATRNIQKVEVTDIEKFDRTINNLMGKSSIPKKEFVFNKEVREVF